MEYICSTNCYKAYEILKFTIDGKNFGRNAALTLVLLRHYTGGRLQHSLYNRLAGLLFCGPTAVPQLEGDGGNAVALNI